MIQPIDFSNLPKISRHDLKLLEAFGRILPRNRFSSEFGRSMRRLIQSEIGLPFSFEKVKVAPYAMKELSPTLSQQAVYAVLGLLPHEEKMIIELDPFLTHVVIDKLLGGSGEPLVMIRPLTEIEEGVISYLFLKLLSQIFEQSGSSSRFHFRLDGFQSSWEGLSSVLSEQQRQGRGVVVSLRLVVGERSGYARLMIPSSFLETSSFLEESSPAPYYSHRIVNFRYVPTEIWGEVGRVNLEGRAINNLEAGDIIVLHETEVKVDRSQGSSRLTGCLNLRVGYGDHGGWCGEILSGPLLRLKLGKVEV